MKEVYAYNFLENSRHNYQFYQGELRETLKDKLMFALGLYHHKVVKAKACLLRK